MPGRRFAKRRSARKGARKALKRVSPGLAKAVKAIAKNEAFKAQETKYTTGVKKGSVGIAGDFVNEQISDVLNSKVLIGNLQYLQPAMPSLPNGFNSATQVGSTIQHARGKVDFCVSLADDGTDATSESANIIVKIFCLESRTTRSMYSLANYMPTQDLLRLGNDSTTDWTPPAYIPEQLNMMPINLLAWKVHHVKTFLLVKNPGRQTGGSLATGASAPNVTGGARRTFSWNWKHDGTLKYNEVGAGSGATGSTDFPTNFAPVYGIVAYYADGQAMNPEELEGIVNVNVRTHMWYKDA